MGKTAVSRKEWIREARKEFSFFTKYKENCAICGKYALVAEAHHIIPLETQFNFHKGTMAQIPDHVWLCPTHHALVHFCIRGSYNLGGDNLHLEMVLPGDEANKLYEQLYNFDEAYEKYFL